MVLFALIGMSLGLLAAMLDLSNRLFGSYRQTLPDAVIRVAIVTSVCLFLFLPALGILAFPQNGLAQGIGCAWGVLGTIVFVHFLFPYRWGIRRWRSESSQASDVTAAVKLREERVSVAGLLDLQRDLTILLLSDLHCNSQRVFNVVDQALDGMSTDGTDLVFVLGDLGERDRWLPRILDRISRVPNRYGCYLVRGNHDYEGGREEVIERLARERGIEPLANCRHYIADLGVALLGWEAPWQPGHPAEIAADGLTIALSHTPDNIRVLAQQGVDLVFTGHTHGGKLTLPGLGAVLLPCRLGRFLDAGWFQLNRTRMFVTRGIGYFPGVLGARGEVARITLHASENGVCGRGRIRRLA